MPCMHVLFLCLVLRGWAECLVDKLPNHRPAPASLQWTTEQQLLFWLVRAKRERERREWFIHKKQSPGRKGRSVVTPHCQPQPLCLPWAGSLRQVEPDLGIMAFTCRKRKGCKPQELFIYWKLGGEEGCRSPVHSRGMSSVVWGLSSMWLSSAFPCKLDPQDNQVMCDLLDSCELSQLLQAEDAHR